MATRAQRELEVLNRASLATRTTGEFIRCIYRFRNEVYVVVRPERSAARRAIDLLQGRLPANHRLTIVAEDPRAALGENRLESFLGQLAEVDRRRKRRGARRKQGHPPT